MCSAAMTAGGGANVGMGLGTGITEAMPGMRIAREDVKQGTSPMADPRINQIYQSMTPASLPGRRPGPTA